VENSIGLGGSTISLCTLLSALDRDAYAPRIALSRASQAGFLERHGHSGDKVALIACRPRRESSTGLDQRTGWARRVNHTLYRVVRPAVSVLDMLCVVLPYAKDLLRFARRVGVDLIHQNNGFDVAAVLAKTALGVPLVAYQRGWEFDSFSVRRLGNWVDRYVANSEAIREHLVDLGIARERIDVVYPHRYPALQSRRRLHRSTA